MSPPPAFDVTVLRDLRVPTGTHDVTLSADLFLPVGPARVPALVTVLPYRKDTWAGILNRDNLHRFASYGYASLLVDLRGTGSSGGDQRPPFHPDEADDGVAAVEWAGSQPWCDGAVGMWGHSYGAVMALRTAARQPPHLKAIVPVMGMLDPERDFVHPAGRRGCLSSLGVWGMHTLLTQLLPPLDGAGDLRRWQGRLDRTEPYLVDLFRHGPDDPAWRSRVVDASQIAVPAFCVGGWQDLFCAATIRAYEQIQAPKRLLVGPWTHTMPDASPFEAADFLTLALPWWDRWLRGIDNGIEGEPPVVLYVQGGRLRGSSWRQYDSWPPAKTTQRFETGQRGTRLRAVRHNGPEPSPRPRRRPIAPIAEHRSDPTAGALGALWGVPSGGLGRPLDQHDDDMRSLTVTTDPSPHDVLMVGGPVVVVTTADGGPARLVVKLTDVDPSGRSILISSAIAPDPSTLDSSAPDPSAPDRQSLVLAPTCYLLPAGHRLRIAVNNADFPRLWPDPGDDLLRVCTVELLLPTVYEDDGTPTSVQRPPAVSASLDLQARSRWVVTRDFVSDGIEVKLAEELTAATPQRHLVRMDREVSASLTPATPAGAVLHGASTALVRMASGEIITVRTGLAISGVALRATGEIVLDGVTIWSRQWQ